MIVSLKRLKEIGRLKISIISVNKLLENIVNIC